MKKTFTILIVAIIMAIGNVAHAQSCNAPVVTSFSPNTGLIGSTVTISGSYFDPVAANNHVMFGATKATVVTASFGTLTVKVPVGATTAPISVRNACNLVAYSSTAFNGIFCPTPINSTTYNNTAFTLSGIYGAYNMLAMDIDLDGKPDVISGSNSGGLTIARNLSTPGNLNFAAHNFGGAGGNSIAVADFDGDGKIDIFSPNAISRNISTGPGNINFQFFGSVGGYQVATGDFNNDGKIDILYQDGSHNLILRRNTSTGPGVISFAHAFSVYVGFRNNGVQIADVDGDGKVDIMASQGDGNRMVSLRNTTAVNATAFTFEPLEAWPSNGVYPYRAMIADFDKDGKIDFTTPNYGHGSADPNQTNTAIFRNTSVVGNISFAPSVNLPAPVNNYRIGVGDVNGDGFPDIVTKSLGVNVFSVYPNVSSGPGNAAFSARIDYSSSAMAEVSGIVIGDLDGDFVPDIATSGISSNTIRFHRNTSAQADVTPPTAISKNITAALSPSGTVTITPEMVDNGSGDACGIASMTVNDAASVTFTCANIGVNTVTLKVTDKGGNVSSTTATVTVAPAAIIVAGQSTVCQGQTVAMNANSGDSYQWYKDGDAIAGATAQSYAATESGNYTVAVTNAGGCSGTSSATAVTVNNNPTVSISPAGTASLCGGSLTLTASQSSTYQWYLNGNMINGATQRTYNATAGGSYTVSVLDLFGCSATSAAVAVNATDNIAPLAKVKNLTVALDANEFASVSIGDINDGSSDNCSNITLALSGQTIFSCNEVGQVVPVTLTVTDASNNVSTAVAMVTVTDPNSYCNAAPVAVAKSLNISAAANCQGTASAQDFNNGSSDADGDAMTFSVSPAGPYAVGSTNVVLTVTDSKGASTSANASVNVADNSNPTVTASGNIQAFTAGNNGPSLSVNVNLPNTNAFVSVNGSTQINFQDALPAGAIITGASVTYYAYYQYSCCISANDLVVSGTHIGSQFPSAPAGTKTLTVNYTGAIPGYVYGGTNYFRLQASWNGIRFNGGTLTLQYRMPASGCEAYVSVPAPATADNCGVASVTNSFNGTANASGTYPKGNTTVTWTVTDVNGNVATTTQTVTVIDNINPTITAPAAVNVFADNGSCNATNVVLGTATAADNCAGVTTSNNAPAAFPVGSTTVTWTATDASGNTATATQVVTVADNQMPVLASVADLSVDTDAGVCGATVNYATPVGTDNCAVSTVQTAGLASGSVFPLGTTTNTFVATDASGNSSTTSFTVTVTDNEAPAVVTQNVSVTLANGTASVTVADIDNGSSDACGIATMALDKTTFSCEELGKNVVTLTVTDNNGNVSTATAMVNVVGVTPTPAIAVTRFGSNINTGAGVNTIFMGYGNQAVTLTASNATSAANATSYSWSPAAGLSNASAANPIFTPTEGGTYTFDVTATNEFGCTATTSVTVKVIDARCGNKMDKVLVCHNGNEICISANAVPAHLAHGCSVGACGSATARGTMTAETAKLEAYPNPFSDRTNLEFSITQDSKFRLEVLDVKGSLVKVMAEGNAKAGKLQAYEFNAGKLSEGVYIVRLVTETEVKHVKMVLKH